MHNANVNVQVLEDLMRNVRVQISAFSLQIISALYEAFLRPPLKAWVFFLQVAKVSICAPFNVAFLLDGLNKMRFLEHI